MGSQLEALGFARLDLSAISGNTPAHFDVCQAISRHVFECRDDNEPQFDGICYRSRPSPEHLNYAVFERTGRAVVAPRPSQAIPSDDPDFVEALRIDRLTLGRPYDATTDVEL